MSSISTGSFFGSGSSRNNESSASSRFGRANLTAAANGHARQQVGEERDSNSSLATRQQGNVVVSSRELGAVFDGMKALTEVVKRQYNDLKKMAGNIEESRKEISEMKEEMQEMRAEINNNRTVQCQETSNYGPVPKALRVIILNIGELD